MQTGLVVQVNPELFLQLFKILNFAVVPGQVPYPTAIPKVVMMTSTVKEQAPTMGKSGLFQNIPEMII